MPNDRPTLCIETPPDGEYPNESLTVSTGPSSPRSPNRRCRWGRPPGTTVIGGRGWPFADRPRSSIDTSDRKVLVNNQQDPYPGSSVGWANPLGPRPGSGRAGGSAGSPTRRRRSFRIAGIRVGASWSALLLGAIFALSFHSYASMSAAVIAGGDTSMVLIVATIVCAALMVASLLAHELAHAVVARRQGVEVSDIRLWAFGGVARILDRPASPRSQALIAGAGPAVSLALVAIFGAVAVGISGDAVGTTAVLAVACWWLAFGNLGLALFNLLPGLPLDGGHLVAAAVWSRTGDERRGRSVAARTGKFIGTLIFVVAVVAAIASSSSYLWTALIGLFIRRAAKAELRQLRAEGMATWMQKMADQFVRGAAGGVGSRVGSPGWGGFGVPGGFGGVPGAQWPSDASPRSNGRVHVDPIDVRVIDDA